MPDVVLDMSGDPNALERALAKAESKVLELQARLKDAGNTARISANQWKAMAEMEEKAFADASAAARKAADDVEKQSVSKFDAVGKSIAGAFNPLTMTAFAGAVASVLGPIELIRKEFERMREVQREAAGTQISVSSSRMSVARNMPGASAAEVEAMQKATRQLAGELNIDEAVINDAMAQALSASGGNRAASISAVSQASKFLVDRPQDIALYAGALLDMAKVTKTQEAATNLGYLSWVSGMSRIVDPMLLAHNAPKALVGATTYGATAKGAGALYAALSTGAADPTGARTGTAMIGLAQQLAEFFPSEGMAARVEGAFTPAELEARRANLTMATKAAQKLAAGKTLSERETSALRREEAFAEREKKQKPREARPAGLTTMDERIAALQGNPALAAEFLAGGSFEKALQAPIMQLLTDASSVTAQQYASNLKSMPEADKLKDLAAQSLANLLVDPAGQTAALQRAFASKVQQIQLGNLAAGQASEIRSGLEALLKATGESRLGAKIASLEWEGSTVGGTRDAFARAADLIAARREDIMHPSEYTGAVFGVTHRRRDPTPRETETAGMLGEMVTYLREIASNTHAPPLLARPDEDR